MKLKKILGRLEAILFASGEPISTARIAFALGVDVSQATNYASELTKKLDEEARGICILKLDGSYQLCSRLEHADTIKLALEVKRNTPLSSAAMEVLAIIAYNQPVTKGFVERIRGVDSSQTVNNLVLKGLVEEAGRLDVPGRPISYQTTSNFLRCFGIASLDKLPLLPEQEHQQLTLEELAIQRKTEETR